MSAAVKKFILLVEVHFPRGKFSGDEAKEAIWLRSMEEMLGDYAPEVLSEAAGTIIRTRDPEKSSTMFPKPSECIRVCDAIVQRKEFEALPIFTQGEPARLMAPVNRPEFKIKRGDATWDEWLSHLEGAGKKDVAQEANVLGYLRTSSVYPRGDSVVFEPRETGQYQFARLQSLN